MKNKTLSILQLLFIIGLFVTQTSLIQAQGSMMEPNENTHSLSLEVVLQELVSNQNVSTIQELDCAKISDEEFEILGDSVMEEQHQGESHEIMDQMMGGEGSESLREAHIAMGSSYLGCSQDYRYNNMMNSRAGMGMGMGMMNYATNDPMFARMSNSYGMYTIFHSITWIAGIAFLLSGTYYFIRRSNKK